MDGTGRQFLAGARLAVDQHAAVGRRHQRDLLTKRLHRDAVAYDDAARLKLFLVFQVLATQPFGFDRVLQNDQCPLDGQRLLEKIESAQLGSPHRGLDVAVSRDHDDLGVIVDLDQIFPTFRRPSMPGSQMSSMTTSTDLLAKCVQTLLATACQ